MPAKTDAFTSFPLEPHARDAAAIVRASPGGRGVAPARLWESLPGGDVRCNACAHRCLIRPDRLGICGVRENRDGRLVTLVFGEVAAATLEPIEKKPLYHVWPGTSAYSIGTQGCNFHCRFCHNWEIAQAPRERLLPRTRHLPPADVVREALASGARSIAWTYTEPTVFIEYVLETAELAREAGLGNVLVTNGYETREAIRLLAPLVEAANVDLKAFRDEVYRRVCGARLVNVLAAIVAMREAGMWVELTTLVIPGVNDDPTGTAAMTRWIATGIGPETPWHVSRFYPAFRMMTVEPTPLDRLELAATIGREAGLRHVYVGNAPETGPADTSCARCEAPLLRRVDHVLVETDLIAGRCAACGYRLAGVGLEEPARVSPVGARPPRD